MIVLQFSDRVVESLPPEEDEQETIVAERAKVEEIAEESDGSDWEDYNGACVYMEAGSITEDFRELEVNSESERHWAVKSVDLLSELGAAGFQEVVCSFVPLPPFLSLLLE